MTEQPPARSEAEADFLARNPSFRDSPEKRLRHAVTAAGLKADLFAPEMNRAVDRAKYPGSYGRLDAETVRRCERYCRETLALLEQATAALDEIKAKEPA